MSDEPQWDLLPDRPQAFFGLEDGFDRKQLKRAYTRLIRVYKPERAPAEFQRIRAAYEALDERLRHFGSGAADLGQAPAAFEPAPEEIRQPTPQAEDTSGADLAPLAKPVPVPQVPALELLEAEGPEALLRALEEHEHKDPRAWVQLALLREELEQGPEPFAGTLVEGTLATQGGAGLLDLLAGLCREPLDPQQAGRLLQLLVKLTSGPGGQGGLHPSAYWYLTEPLWLRLLRDVKFESFRTLLERCAEGVGEAGWRGRQVLDLRLLRRACAKAEEGWYRDLRLSLDENAQHLGEEEQHELDLAAWLLAALHHRQELVDGQAVRAPLDQAILAICEGDEVRADRAFLAAMVHVFEQGEELLESVPPQLHLPEESLRALAYWDEGLRERRGDPEHLTQEQAQAEVAELLRRIEHRTDRSLQGRLFGLLANLTFALAVMTILLSWILVADYAADNAAFFVVPLAVAGLVITAYSKGWFGRTLARVWIPLARRLYRKLWRPMLVEFLSDNPMSRGQLLTLVHHDRQEDVTNGPSLLENAAEDHGLWLYALACTYLE